MFVDLFVIQVGESTFINNTNATGSILAWKRDQYDAIVPVLYNEWGEIKVQWLYTLKTVIRALHIVYAVVL